jgi:predicted neuraminidase
MASQVSHPVPTTKFNPLIWGGKRQEKRGVWDWTVNDGKSWRHGPRVTSQENPCLVEAKTRKQVGTAVRTLCVCCQGWQDWKPTQDSSDGDVDDGREKTGVEGMLVQIALSPVGIDKGRTFVFNNKSDS